MELDICTYVISLSISSEYNPKATKRIANVLQYGIKKLKEFQKLGLVRKKKIGGKHNNSK